MSSVSAVSQHVVHKVDQQQPRCIGKAVVVALAVLAVLATALLTVAFPTYATITITLGALTTAAIIITALFLNRIKKVQESDLYDGFFKKPQFKLTEWKKENAQAQFDKIAELRKQQFVGLSDILDDYDSSDESSFLHFAIKHKNCTFELISHLYIFADFNFCQLNKFRETVLHSILNSENLDQVRIIEFLVDKVPLFRTGVCTESSLRMLLRKYPTNLILIFAKKFDNVAGKILNILKNSQDAELKNKILSLVESERSHEHSKGYKLLQRYKKKNKIS